MLLKNSTIYEHAFFTYAFFSRTPNDEDLSTINGQFGFEDMKPVEISRKLHEYSWIFGIFQNNPLALSS